MSATSLRSGLLRVVVAATIAVPITGASVSSGSAGDFTRACEDNSALDSGKLSDKDKKSCGCIKAKLDEKAQSDVGSVLEKLLVKRKAGKGNEKPDMTPDEQKAMGAFVSGMQGCVTANQ